MSGAALQYVCFEFWFVIVFVSVYPPGLYQHVDHNITPCPDVIFHRVCSVFKHSFELALKRRHTVQLLLN